MQMLETRGKIMQRLNTGGESHAKVGNWGGGEIMERLETRGKTCRGWKPGGKSCRGGKPGGNHAEVGNQGEIMQRL